MIFMRSEPTTTDNIIDSRDIVEYIECQTDYLDVISEDEIDRDDEIQEIEKEIAMWQDFLDEAEGYSGDRASDGITFIHDSYFTEHAEELARDCGIVSDNAGWPNNCIDWEKAADELKQDYTCLEIDGNDYWVR